MAEALHYRDHGGAIAGESEVRLSPLQAAAAGAGSSGSARPTAAANARCEIHSRNAQWALTSTCSRGGNACAMVQRWATTGRRGTANLVAFGTNGGLRKLIECESV